MVEAVRTGSVLYMTGTKTERWAGGDARSAGTDIFISYSRRDLAGVKPIKEERERGGFSCWWTSRWSKHSVRTIEQGSI